MKPISPAVRTARLGRVPIPRRVLGLPLGAWLLLTTVPLIALGAHQFMSAAFARRAHDRGQISLLEDATGTTQFEAYAASLVADEPRTAAARAPVIAGMAAHAMSVISQLRASAAGDSRAVRATFERLAGANDAYQGAIRQLVSGGPATSPASVREIYASEAAPAYGRLSSNLNATLKARSKAAATAASTATVTGWLSFGGATALIVAILLWFALLSRRLARRSGEAAVEETKRQFQAIVDASGAAMFVYDREGRYLLTNRIFDEGLGVAPGDPIGRRREDVMPAEVIGELEDEHRRVLAGETVSSEHRFARDGVSRKVSLVKFPLTDANGVVYAVCGVATDISDVRQMQHQIAQLSDHDPLTGLFNRRRLMREIETHLHYAARHKTSGALVLLDIDNFKLVNDSYGHSSGDRQLAAVARVLRERVRETDTIARLGSDEFAIVLSEVNEKQALRVASSVQSLLYEPPTGPPIQVSIGISLFDGSAEVGAGEVLVAADSALYEAKQEGGGHSVVYHGQASSTLTWVHRIRAALAEHRFCLYSQPILDLGSGHVSHHELLIRMLSPAGELIPPAVFVPAAERFGLIGDIDRWVVSEALRHATAGRRVAVNLSAYSLSDAQIVAQVREAVGRGLEPSNLTFEITETTLIRNAEEARLLAGTLAGIGCGLALDDFGTGFGSFVYLKHLPARYLKIDMEFVRNASRDRTDQEIIGSITGIAHALGKQTVAEGVEDQETLRAIREQGVDFAQGYYIGRPAPLSEPTTVHERAA